MGKCHSASRISSPLPETLTLYACSNSVSIERGLPTGNTIGEIATRLGRSRLAVVLRWTVQRGVGVIPRSGSEPHILENLEVTEWSLDEEDMQRIDLCAPESHPYYWKQLNVDID